MGFWGLIGDLGRGESCFASGGPLSARGGVQTGPRMSTEPCWQPVGWQGDGQGPNVGWRESECETIRLCEQSYHGDGGAHKARAPAALGGSCAAAQRGDPSDRPPFSHGNDQKKFFFMHPPPRDRVSESLSRICTILKAFTIGL
jgi:hypothetical protein